MAAIVDMCLKREVTVSHIIEWLKNPLNNFDSQLDASVSSKSEFIPFFLNYLRDKTLYLLQNARVATPSPVKDSSGPDKKLSVIPRKCRGKLFNPSVLHESQRIHGHGDAKTSLISPQAGSEANTIIHKDNSELQSSSDKKNKDYWKTPESCKFKARLSLGDFLSEADQNRKINKTPCSDGETARSSYSFDNSLSKPIFRQGNRNKSKTHAKIQKNLGQEFSIYDSGDFPQLQSGDAKPIVTKPSRRISPTPVACESKRTHLSVTSKLPEVPEQNPFPVAVSLQREAASAHSGSLCLEHERTLLRKERAKIQELASSQTSLSLARTPHKASIERGSGVMDIPAACLSQVTNPDCIELLAVLYSRCLQENLLPNMNVELYFLIQLLTSRGPDPSLSDNLTAWDDDDGGCNYLNSLHNVVYFAVIVLQRHLRLVSLLDHATLRLLADNQRVQDFSPSLSEHLAAACDSTTSQRVSPSPLSPIASVSFQAETDNRKNFPTEHAFHVFKKQRDMFYELIREWELNHTTPGWDMKDKMRDRIIHLLNYNTDLSNYIHFARLFNSQLIAMCKSDGHVMNDTDEEKITLLMQLKTTNPDKFKRLQERFVTPLNTNTPCPTPHFPGSQEFFHDFIFIASSHVFNQHLIDHFSAKIIQLNELQLADVDIDINQHNGTTHQEDRELFASTLMSLRLVAKFLGYVMFLPYQSREKLCDALVPSCLQLRRSQMNLPLDVHTMLVDAWGSGRLCLTIPWVVQLLAMMDDMASRIPHVRRTLSLLINIYRHVSRDMNKSTPTNHHLLIIFTLGWLFELPPFPEEMFYHAIVTPIDDPPNTSTTLKNLDDARLVDQRLLYTCCPYLGELRCLLTEFAMGSRGQPATIRKITPISADVRAPPVTDQQLQGELEESFFHNQPASLKRVVEFTADRTASNYIKKFRNGTLQSTLVAGRERVGHVVQKIAQSSPCHSAKERAMKRVYDIAQDLQNDMRHHVATTCMQFCSSIIDRVIPLLLPEEQTTAVVAMAATLCSRQAEEKVNEWMSKHISQKMFHDELCIELHKQWKAVLLGKVPPADTLSALPTYSETYGQTDTAQPSDLLIALKECAARLLCGAGEIGEVRTLLTWTAATATQRQDVLTSVHSLYQQITIDISQLTLCHLPDKWTPELAQECCQLWTMVKPNTPNLHTHLISHRLVSWLHLSPDPQLSWRHLRYLLHMCVLSNLVTDIDLLQQLQQTLARSLPQEQIEEIHLVRDSLTPQNTSSVTSDSNLTEPAQSLDRGPFINTHAPRPQTQSNLTACHTVDHMKHKPQACCDISPGVSHDTGPAVCVNSAITSNVLEDVTNTLVTKPTTVSPVT